MQSRVIISSAVRDLRLLVREKRAVQVMFPRVRIPPVPAAIRPAADEGLWVLSRGPVTAVTAGFGAKCEGESATPEGRVGVSWICPALEQFTFTALTPNKEEKQSWGKLQ